jgi:hypothetical protein
MADYYTRYAGLLPLGLPENVSAALDLFRALSDELQTDEECLGFEAEHANRQQHGTGADDGIRQRRSRLSNSVENWL